MDKNGDGFVTQQVSSLFFFYQKEINHDLAGHKIALAGVADHNANHDLTCHLIALAVGAVGHDVNHD